MLEISPVSYNTVNFKKNKNSYSNQVQVYKTYKTEATAAKKWGVGIASWIIPGSGQAINNEWDKALGFFGLSVIAPFIISLLSGGIGIFSGLTGKSKAATAAGVIGIAASWLAAIGGRIWACVDSVKNAKSEVNLPIKE